ncbi:hypothetical protein V3C99_002633 [Haemonchus contortus]|uniref:Peptidase A2 domain-containing protein n=1 Tax=Haemonchus contortus TaxID=6289 RepID=A0A7I5E8N5_HAECO
MTASALIDSGSMASIIPITLLEKAQANGYDVDALFTFSAKEVGPVYDASAGNEMKIVGAVTLEVTLDGGGEDKVTFHITPLSQDEVLLGMNSLQKLGVRISIIGSDAEGASGCPKGKGTDLNKVEVAKVTRRAYVSPHTSAMIEVDCRETGPEERVLWTNRKEVASGIFKVCDQRTTIPVHNDGDTAIVFKVGEEVGEWSTEKWNEKWEDLNPLLLDSVYRAVNKEERRQQLTQQLDESSGKGQLDDELVSVLKENEDAFAVSEKELYRTTLTEMDIDTAEHPPVKLKARPLSIRLMLRELLEDLQARHN